MRLGNKIRMIRELKGISLDNPPRTAAKRSKSTNRVFHEFTYNFLISSLVDLKKWSTMMNWGHIPGTMMRMIFGDEDDSVLNEELVSKSLDVSDDGKHHFI